MNSYSFTPEKIQKLKDFWKFDWDNASPLRRKVMMTGAHNEILDAQGNSLAQIRIGLEGVHFSDIIILVEHNAPASPLIQLDRG